MTIASNSLKPLLLLGAAALLAGCAASPPPAASSAAMQDAHLRVNVFAGSTNLPLLVAIDKGFMRERKISIAIQNTPDSDQQRVVHRRMRDLEAPRCQARALLVGVRCVLNRNADFALAHEAFVDRHEQGQIGRAAK